MTADDKPEKCSGRDEQGDVDQIGSQKHMTAKLD